MESKRYLYYNRMISTEPCFFAKDFSPEGRNPSVRILAEEAPDIPEKSGNMPWTGSVIPCYNRPYASLLVSNTVKRTREKNKYG
jgi:hypothetical protein